METNTGKGNVQGTGIKNVSYTGGEFVLNTNNDFFYLYGNEEGSVFVDSQNGDTNQELYILAGIVPPVVITKIYESGTTVTNLKVIY